MSFNYRCVYMYAGEKHTFESDTVSDIIKELKNKHNIEESDIISITKCVCDIDTHKICNILKPYRWKGHSRSCFPIETIIRDKSIDELFCPCCNELGHLRYDTDDNYYDTTYQVFCDKCNYWFPTKSTDVGESLCDAKEQIAVYELIGKPVQLLNCDLSLLLCENKDNAIKLNEHNYKEGVYSGYTYKHNKDLFDMDLGGLFSE